MNQRQCGVVQYFGKMLIIKNKLKNNIKYFFLYSIILMLVGFNLQSKNVKIIVSIDKAKNYYYFKNDMIVAIVLSKKDSIHFEYKNNLLTKIIQFENSKLTGEAEYSYNSKNEVIDLTYSEDYNDFYESYITRIPYINKYNLLEKDFVYIDAILSNVKNSENYFLNKKIKLTNSLNFKLNLGVDLCNYRISPFIFGDTIKNLELIIKNNLLIEMKAVLIDESSRKKITYRKLYTYDKMNRLKSTKTINITNKKVESQENIEYVNW